MTVQTVKRRGSLERNNNMKNNMDQGDVDLSVLRTPIPTSVTGFLGVMKAFGDGTEEVIINF